MFRHKWDSHSKGEYKYIHRFNRFELGVWYEKNRMVGTKNFNNPNTWGENLVNCYMLGVNLLVCKAWMTIDRGGKHFTL